MQIFAPKHYFGKKNYYLIQVLLKCIKITINNRCQNFLKYFIDEFYTNRLLYTMRWDKGKSEELYCRAYNVIHIIKFNIEKNACNNCIKETD